MPRRTAFLTGATGFLGRNVLEALLGGGWEVTCLHRPTSRLGDLPSLPVRLAAGELDDRASVLAAMPEGLDTVFHVAGNTSLWPRQRQAQYRDNVVGTRNVVEAARERGARRLVHTSTFVVYRFSPEPVTEESPKADAGARIHYVRTKLLAEREVLAGVARGLDAVIVNPSNIVGPHDLHNWARLIRLVHRGALPGGPPGSGSFCHSREVARAHLAAADRGAAGESFLLGGADATYLELIRIAGELAGRKVPRRPTPALVLRVYARLALLGSLFTGREPEVTPEAVELVTARHHCRSDKAVRELGYRPATLREMVEDSYRWLAEVGALDR